MKKICALLLLLCTAATFTGCEPSDSPSNNSPGGNTSPPSSEIPSDSKIENYIYCNSITASLGSEISVPISIKNNSGICGFEIIISYDENVLTPKSVTASSALSAGNFNDSIATMQDGSFSVVWSGVSNITDDIELFVVQFDVNDTEKRNSVINISYVQENTINDDIDEVALNCNDITINIQSED